VNPLEANRDETMLHPDLRMAWLRLCEAALNLGCPIFLTEGYRSARRQELLYAQGRTSAGPIVTHARAGQSWHEAKRAVDFAFRGASPFHSSHPWELIATMAEHLGLEAGYRWKKQDKPHLQLTQQGLTLDQALAQLKET